MMHAAILAITFALGGIGTSGYQTKTDGSISDEMVRDDARLRKRISIRLPDARIGEFVAEIGALSGIPIAAGMRDGASDESVAVYAADLETVRIMNGLRSAMSSRGGRWAWHRSGDRGNYRYHLAQPLAARQLRDKLRTKLESQLRSDVDRLLNALDGSDKDREDALAETYGENGPKPFPADRVWADVRSFKEALSPEQRAAILSGDFSMRIPLSAVPASSRVYYQEAHKAASATTGSSLPPPANLVIQHVNVFGSPQIMITVPNATIAYPVLGSVHRRMEYWKRAEELWEFDAQPAPARAEEQEVSQVVIDDKEVFTPRNVTLPNGQTVKMDPDAPFKLVSLLSRRFEEIGLGVGVPVIARLPQDQQRSVLPEAAGMTLAEYWKKIWNAQIMHKWHQGVLLFCSTRWALEDLPIPAEDVKKLQKTNRDELLPFPLLVDLADRFSKEQLLRLRLDFPSMVRLAETRGMFALFKRHPNLVRQAMSKNGLAITRDVADALRASLSWRVYEPIHLGRAAVVGISKREESGDTPRREVTLTVYSQEGFELTSMKYVEEVRRERGRESVNQQRIGP